MTQVREHQRPATAKRTRLSKTGRSRVAGSGRIVRVHSEDDVTDVTVSKAHYGRIAKNHAVLKKIIAKYADTARKAERTGKAFEVTYSVSPEGQIEVVREASAEPATSILDAAIARAKERGSIKVADILKRAEMLNARDFGLLIGTSYETVNTKRKRHEVLGLEGAKRGVKYPRWQVTDDGRPLPGLAALFEVLGEQPWTVYRFLRSVHPELGGRTALDTLKTGEIPAVIGAAKNQVAGNFS